MPVLPIKLHHSTRDHRRIVKFADDYVIVSLLQDGEDSQGPVVEVKWCEDIKEPVPQQRSGRMSQDPDCCSTAVSDDVIAPGKRSGVVRNSNEAVLLSGVIRWMSAE
ncbi:hypothetical protein AAFF_G00090240 [Aldrovandia affinis]|uniref:Uncharacterized protein n=1 Tax=Aldrovandia affinis TaxID=143900 RepID=A0AAD7WCY4_9TELE|nr:hypothetical protein AAFF_G00090240 [Aldrovandia affinis]